MSLPLERKGQHLIGSMPTGYLQNSTWGPDWSFKCGQVRDVAAEQRGCGQGPSGLQRPSTHVLLEMGRVWGSPCFRESEACGHRGAPSLAAGSIVLLSAILISPSRLCWKKNPGETGSFRVKPGLSVRCSLVPLGVLCLGGKAPPGGAAPRPQPHSGGLTSAPCSPSLGLCLSHCWALGSGASVNGLSSHPRCRRRVGGRREELGFESRGPGLVFPLHRQ